MDSNLRPIPQFSSEDEEREFWTTHDSTEYIDWSKAERNPPFVRLKHIPYQSLMKMYLSEKVKEETSADVHSSSD